MSGIECRQMPYQDPAAVRLVGAAMADLAVRYGGSGDDTPVAPEDFEPPHGAFLIAYQDGVPVGCGAWRSHDQADGSGGTVAEIKRMYVVPAARRQGVGEAVLRAVEESARSHGCTRAILETGWAQPEAIAMYVKAGYHPVPHFGHYRDHPGVRSFGRDLCAQPDQAERDHPGPGQAEWDRVEPDGVGPGEAVRPG